MATLASTSTTTCCDQADKNGYQCPHSLALLTGEVAPTTTGETISLLAAQQMILGFRAQALLRAQMEAGGLLLSPASPAPESTLGHRYQLYNNNNPENVLDQNAAKEEPVANHMLPGSNSSSTGAQNITETPRNSNDTNASFLSTPPLTPDGSNTGHSSSDASASPHHSNNQEKGTSDTSPSPSALLQGSKEERIALRRQQQLRRLHQHQQQGSQEIEIIRKSEEHQPQGSQEQEVIPTSSSEQARPNLLPLPLAVRPPSFTVQLCAILASGRLDPSAVKMYAGWVNIIYRIGQALKPYINHYNRTDNDDDENIIANIMTEETVMGIYKLAEQLIHGYDEIRAEVRERVEMLAQAKLLLPRFETAVETEQLRTTVGIWRQQLKDVNPYPRDEIHLFRQFCTFYDKAVYHFFLKAHRRAPLPSHLALAPHLDAIYAVVEDAAVLAEQYQRELKALHRQIHHAQKRLENYEAADHASAALDELIKQVDERIRRQGEEEVPASRAFYRRS